MVEQDLSIEEALSVAVLLQQKGRMDDAEKVCRAVLEAVPGHPDALHFLSLSLHRRGANEEAVSTLESVLERFPDHADAWSNLGIFHRTFNDYEKAAAAFERALLINPEHVNALSNLGLTRRAQGRQQEAETVYRRALAIDPKHAGAWHNLGVLLENRGQIPEAVEAYSRASVYDPANADSKRMLAHAYMAIGEKDKAIESVEAWLQEQPGNPVAIHLLAAIRGTDIPARASDACVEQMFDSFAATFDKKLRNLRYQAPELVSSVLAEHLPPPSRSLAIADAGCGTGLCGPLLAPYARSLVGVDLSAKMLAHAHERAIYDELVKSELTEFLESHPHAYDVIVSADTLVYFGDLTRVLSAMAQALTSDGMLAFTLERTTTDPSEGFVLEAHGRYAHTESYARDLLASLGLTVKVIDVDLRMEAGRPVRGLLVWARAAASDRTQ